MMLAQVNVTAPANMWEIAPNIIDAIIAVIRQLDTDPTPVIARVGDPDITAIWVSDSDQLGSCIELHATRPDNGSGPGYGWIVPSMYHDTDWAFTGTPERFADSALDATTLTAISGLLNSLTGVNEAAASAGPEVHHRRRTLDPGGIVKTTTPLAAAALAALAFALGVDWELVRLHWLDLPSEEGARRLRSGVIPVIDATARATREPSRR